MTTRTLMVALPQGGSVRVIAGLLALADTQVAGPVNGHGDNRSTDPLYIDVDLPTGAEFTAPVTAGHNSFIYTYEGAAQLGPADREMPLPHRAAGVLSDGDTVRVRAGKDGTRFLLLAAKPLREPVIQYGPFVMNTREEIEQALADYRDGRLAVA
jgi:redox-sensitive bicupin YhaK (pirin superfamily)